MNALYLLLFLLSGAVLLLSDPAAFLPALLDGASRAAVLSASLLASYAVWLGLMRLWEESGVTRGISRLLRPLSRRLFKTDDEETLSAIGMNLSANLLGIGSAATPYGIRAAELLEQRGSRPLYSSSMLFVVNATSLQLIPTSVIAMRIAAGSASAADILLPTLLTTAFSTLLGVLLTRLFVREKKAHPSGTKFDRTAKSAARRSPAPIVTAKGKQI